MAAGQLATKGQPANGGKGTSWPSKVFEFNPAGLHWPRAVLVLDVMLVPLDLEKALVQVVVPA